MRKNEKSIKEKIKWKASFTIEASFILPLIVYLVWNIVYLSFFLYNRSILLQGSYCTALRTERLYGTEDENREEAEAKYRLAVKEKIAGGAIAEEKQVTKNEVTVLSKLDIRAPGEQFFWSNWHGEERQTAEKFQPVTFIRNCRKTENIWNLLQTGKG